MKYLIWSNEHNAWWAPAWCGYVQKIENAGRYSLEEAIDISNSANYCWDMDNLKKLPNELPISEEAAILLIQRKENNII